MSDFWSFWVAAIIAINIGGCVVLLFLTRRGQKFDEHTTETTGHEYDGIQELDNPLPKWWLLMFYGSIFFSIGYLILYPGMGNYKGLLGWTSTNQWEREVAKADEKYGSVIANYARLDTLNTSGNRPFRSVQDIMNDDLAMDSGRRLFLNNCAACHGSTATGSLGFPNLTDNDWLYGGSFAKIKETLHQGRNGVMPARGLTGQLNDREIIQLAHYVRGLSGISVDQTLATEGKALFMSTKGGCHTCHGSDGRGMQSAGAPNLTDDIWLYGGRQEEIEFTLRHGRKGYMPAWLETIGEDQIHLISAYIYSLSQEE